MAANHRCRRSDHISRIADRAHFRRWETIWEHDRNADLRGRRQNPHMLFKGDRNHRGDLVFVPDPDPGGAPAATEAHHPHVAPGQELFLHLRILKDDFTPVANAPYELDVAGAAAPLTGETESDGTIHHPIPRVAQRATLIVRVEAEDTDAITPPAPAPAAPAAPPAQQPLRSESPIRWELKIGGLNPILEQAPDNNCVSGVQARLNNLCFDAGPVDGVLNNNAQTDAAIKAFQQLFQTATPPTGVPDVAQTQQRLFQVCDSVAGPTTPPAPAPAPAPAPPGP